MAEGQRGEAIRDLQRRLGTAGFSAAGDDLRPFRRRDAGGSQAFQQVRGLHANGRCDEPTWLALVEAGWSLGDRLLMIGAPHLRGDDVAELQNVLNQLGFDCGRPDGILGPATVRALQDFQRNSGLTVDGVCGPQSVACSNCFAGRADRDPASRRSASSRP